MKEIGRKILAVLACGVVLLTGLAGCSGSGNDIVGTWVEEDGNDILVFNQDGTCTAPFTYNPSWIESADHYAITNDGTLVFSSSGGHANDSFEKTDNREEAIGSSSYYYLSGDTLIVDGDIYLKS